MRIQHNIPAMSAYRYYTNNTKALAKNLEKLSSGYKINRAGDDAAGLAISEKMRAQITGLEVAQKNAKDGISLVQTAEGALTEVHDMLNRMFSLAEQSANGTYDDTVDRVQLQKEINQLSEEIDRISKATNFNGIKLLDGSLGGATSSAITMKADPEALNLADGVIINAPRDGAGTKAALEVTFKHGTEEEPVAFGTGDSVTFNVSNNGTAESYTFNFGATAGAATASSAGTFAGADFDAQMDSLVSALNSTSAFSTDYTASVLTDADGNKTGVKIEAKSDSAIPAIQFKGLSDNGVVVKDQKIKVETSNYTPGANFATAATADDKGLKNLIVANAADSNATEIQEGATVKFDFSVNGETLSITLKASKDGTGKNEFKIGDDTDATTTNIVNALTNASFDQKDSSPAIDETQLKFSDYFIATANHDGTNTGKSGSIKISADTSKAGNKNTVNKVTQAQVTSADGTAASAVTATAGAATGADGTGTPAAVADSTTYKFSNTFSAGDQVTLTGKLSDGRDFEIILTAAATGSAADKTFTMGANASASVTGIIDALTSADCKVNVTDADGNKEEVAANAIFSTGTSTDLQLTATGDSLKIANTAVGAAGVKGATAKFSNLQIKSGGTLDVDTATATAGKTPGKAENIITFDDPSKIENGTTITIDGKNYEFVTDANRLSGDPNNTTAVVVDKLGEAEATADVLAKALASALTGNTATGGADYNPDNNTGKYVASNADAGASGATFDVSVENGALVLKSVAEGSAAKALTDVKMTYADRDVVQLDFNTTKKTDAAGSVTYEPQVKVGDTVTVNGKTYEFTNGDRTNGKNEDGVYNTAVDITGKTDIKSIVETLRDVIERNDQTVMATVETTTDAGGLNINGVSLKLTGKFRDGAEVQFKAPEVETPRTSKSLDLQIGDDAQDYNRMEVKINAVNMAEMGLSGLDISTQESARAAMDKIKSAINYVSDVRGTLGATQNRLDHTINNLSVMQENIQDAESTIRDVDVAKEMMAYTKNNILVQSAQAMLAQANQLPQGVLQLLQ